ncbi:hypothetical protein F5883DRAFT_561684 [Diaporthe sp. PMI_573]|nr:hypothetical protein F5883DRAFT_561684 [Diaporthaceae sp. PMI_573]
MWCFKVLVLLPSVFLERPCVPRELPTGWPLPFLGFEFCVMPLLVMIALRWWTSPRKCPRTRLGSAQRSATSLYPPPVP